MKTKRICSIEEHVEHSQIGGAHPRFGSRRKPDLRVHPGGDRFYVLSGTARLVLGERELLVETGQAAEFATMTPHWIGTHGGPLEILSIFDLHREKAHLRAPAARASVSPG